MEKERVARLNERVLINGFSNSKSCVPGPVDHYGKRLKWRRCNVQGEERWLPTNISFCNSKLRFKVVCKNSGITNFPVVGRSLEQAYARAVEKLSSLLGEQGGVVEALSGYERFKVSMPQGMSTYVDCQNGRGAPQLIIRYTHRLTHPQAIRQHQQFSRGHSLKVLQKNPEKLGELYDDIYAYRSYSLIEEGKSKGKGLRNLARPEAIDPSWLPMRGQRPKLVTSNELLHLLNKYACVLLP